MARASVRIGLISDTHGLLRPEAVAFLRGSHAILHAGDIGDASIIARLSTLAPTTAVRGNNDTDDWAREIPAAQTIVIGSVSIHVVHDLNGIAVEPDEAGIRVVVSGHSHRPRIDYRGDVLYINPGSAGPRRFTLPISVGELLVDDRLVTPRLVSLAVATAGPRLPEGRPRESRR